MKVNTKIDHEIEWLKTEVMQLKKTINGMLIDRVTVMQKANLQAGVANQLREDFEELKVKIDANHRKLLINDQLFKTKLSMPQIPPMPKQMDNTPIKAELGSLIHTRCLKTSQKMKRQPLGLTRNTSRAQGNMEAGNNYPQALVAQKMQTPLSKPAHQASVQMLSGRKFNTNMDLNSNNFTTIPTVKNYQHLISPKVKQPQNFFISVKKLDPCMTDRQLTKNKTQKIKTVLKEEYKPLESIQLNVTASSRCASSRYINESPENDTQISKFEFHDRELLDARDY